MQLPGRVNFVVLTMNAANSVSVLLKTDFNRLPLEDKIKLKELGRPMPDLNLTQISERKAQNRTFTRHFSRDIYNRNKWICGCEILNLLYCFPCILFYNPAATGVDPNWARTGIKDLHHLPAKIKKHESSRGHINACTAFALLGNANIMTQLNSAYRQHVIDHNEKVRKNRYILKRIICCVKFCSAFELALRGHDESEESGNRGIFRELVDFSAELDVTLREHLQNATVFKGTSKIIQNDILDCMLDVCKEEICSQIKKSEFLSVQCDETTDVTNWCQLVLIFRYVYDGNVHENFWGFKRVKDKSAMGLQKCIEEEIDPLILETPQKLIAQTYDGANVMSGAVGGVQAYVKIKYPCAHYVHCYAHQLNLLMQKAASQHAKVRVFFNNLSAIPAFFSNSSNRGDVLEEVVNRRLPRVAVTRWNYNIRTVKSVFENREKLIEVFEEIEEKCLRSTTSNEASGLRRALEDPEFMFWLTFFHKLLPHVDILYNQIQSRNKDSIQLQSDLQNFEKCVRNVRNDTDAIQRNIEENFHSTKRRRRNEEDDVQRSVYAKEVCDVIVSQMKDRFSYRGHLQAAELFNTELFTKFAKVFPVDLLNTVCSAYPFLCKIRLKTELEVIYSRPDFGQVIGAMNFLSLMLQNNLTETFPEAIKLLKVILTTPMTTAESERCFSTLKRIKTFLRNTMGNDRLSALAMMSINKNLVQDIDNFEEKVLEKFISMKDRRAEFSFKK